MNKFRFNLSAYFVLLVALSLTGLASFYFVRQTRMAARARFDKATATLQASLRERLNLYASLLTHTRAIYGTQPQPNAKSFREYFQSLDFARQYPGAIAMGFAPREMSSASELTAGTVSVRSENTPSGETFRVAIREPAGPHSILGTDLARDPTLWSAMLRARDAGEVVISGPVKLSKVSGTPTGFVMMTPIYRRELAHPAVAGVDARRANLRGFLYLSVNSQKFFESIAHSRAGAALSFRVEDRTNEGIDSPLYAPASVAPADPQATGKWGIAQDDGGEHLESRDIFAAGGRRWRITHTARASFDGPSDPYVSVYVLLAGILASTLLFGIVWSNRNQSDIERRLLVQAQRARREAEGTASRNSLLAEASKLLFSSFEADRIFQSVAEITVPAFADACAVDILEDERNLRRRVSRHANEEKAEILARYEDDGFAGLDQDVGAQKVVRTGQALLLSEVSRDVLAGLSAKAKLVEWVQELELKSLVIVPIPGREGIWGAMSFYITESRRRFEVNDLNFAEELGRRIGLALDHAALYRRSQEANRAKTNFLANMSHEIRTPLGAILGFTDLLRNPKSRDIDRDGYLSTIQRNGRQLARLLDELLDLSKIESGRLQIENSATSVVELIHEIVDLLRPQAAAKGIQLRARCDGPIPRHIQSDPLRLRQILVNIVGNALKFTERGTVEIEVRLDVDSEADEPTQLCVKVHDTGIGITRRQSERLFRPFSQADSSTSRRFGGTGLGLVLSRRLAQALGGNLMLERSVPGQGSTFTLVLNLDNLEGMEMTTSLNEDDDRQSSPEEAGELSLENVRVLVVEDSPDNQLLIEQLLVNFGAEVGIANDGFEGIAKAQSEHFDVILMDVQMPRMDGCEAAQRLRREGYRRPILALTAHAMREERERCLRSGCNDHLTKPIDALNLISKVAHHARQSRRDDLGTATLAFAARV